MKPYLILSLCLLCFSIGAAEQISNYTLAKSSREEKFSEARCNSKCALGMQQRSKAGKMIQNYNVIASLLSFDERVACLKAIYDSYLKARKEYTEVIDNCQQQDKKGKTWCAAMVGKCRKEVEACDELIATVEAQIEQITITEAEIEKTKQFIATNETIKQLWGTVSDKSQQAEKKRISVEPSLTNIKEVFDAITAAAQLYEAAAADCRQALALSCSDEDRKTFTDKLSALEVSAKACRQEAIEWTEKVAAQKQALKDLVVALRNEASSSEENGMERHSWETHQQIAAIIKKLIDCHEMDNCDLAETQEKIAFFENEADARHLKADTAISETFHQEEKLRKEQFFSSKEKSPTLMSPIVTSLDGSTLYTEQFYRFLIQTDSSASSLQVNVSENGTKVYEERIALPMEGTQSWHYYITSDEMMIIPETALKSQFGLDLRISIVFDPNHNLSLLISHKVMKENYTFAFSLADEPLYVLNFSPPPPWQLA